MRRLTFLFFLQGLFVFNSLLHANPPASVLSEYSQKLDSVVTYNNSGDVVRTVKDYVFDEDNQLISCVEETVGSVFKYESGFDACGNQISYIIAVQNAGNWTVQFEERTEYEYDAGCNNPRVKSYFSEGIPETESSAFKNEYILYYYNANGKIEKVEKKANSGGAVIQEIEYVYDSEGKTISISYKNLENNIFAPSSKVEYTYFPILSNIDHFETETIYKYDNNVLVKCMETIYDPSEFLSNNQLTTTIKYYDEDGIDCLFKEVRISRYTTTGNLQEYELHIYDDDMNTPSNIVLYDSQGNIISEPEPTIDDSPLWTGTWTYNDINGIDTYTVRSNDESSLLQWSMAVFYYIPTDKQVVEAVRYGFDIYPNPVNDHLYIAYNINDNSFVPIHYAIYNLTGRLQLRGVILSEKAFVDVQSLPSGSYVITFTANDDKGTSVFIKK